MRQKLPTYVKIVALLALMPVCGLIALIVAVVFLMGIGLWMEDNYELLASGSNGIVIVAGAFAVGAAVPVLLLWRWFDDEAYPKS